MNSCEKLLEIICLWIHSLGYKAVKGPSNNPAPEGMHISCGVSNVQQEGDPFIPPPKKKLFDKLYKAYMYVATVQFYEVEGSGEALRKIRNSLQSDQFDDFVKKNSTQSEDGLDLGFSVWNVGDIVDNGTQDGTYYISQKTMTVQFQFYDFEENLTENIRSVSGNLNSEFITIEG